MCTATCAGAPGTLCGYPNVAHLAHQACLARLGHMGYLAHLAQVLRTWGLFLFSIAVHPTTTAEHVAA
eukprot:4814594-Pyramimonas_sp.AAC.1